MSKWDRDCDVCGILMPDCVCDNGHYELSISLLGKEQLRVVFPEKGGYMVNDPYLSVDVRYIPPEEQTTGGAGNSPRLGGVL